MIIIDLLDKKTVKTPLKSTNKENVIKELVQILKDAKKIKNINDVIDAVKEREEIGSTGLGNGLAIPHAKTDIVDSITIALGISKDGIDFEALDGKNSNIFFLILAPPEHSSQHMEALSEIANLVKDETFCDNLLKCKSSKDVLKLLKESN